MHRILIVEDQEDTLRQLALLLREHFLEVQGDTAGTAKDAQELLDRSLRQGCPYDVAILDCKLPVGLGENPEVDVALSEAFRDTSPETVLIHVTAYTEDPRLRARFDRTEEYEAALHAQGRVFISKGAGWSERLVQEVEASLHERYIRKELNALFPTEGAVGSNARGAGRPRRSDRAWSGRLAALCSYVSEHWDSLRSRPALQKQIRDTLRVVEDQGVVQVGVVIEPPAEDKEPS